MKDIKVGDYVIANRDSYGKDFIQGEIYKVSSFIGGIFMFEKDAHGNLNGWGSRFFTRFDTEGLSTLEKLIWGIE